MDVSNIWELVRLVVVVGLMSALFFWSQKRPPVDNGDGNQMRTIRELNTTVNTLARQLDDSAQRMHLLELDNTALKADNKALTERVKELESKSAIVQTLLPVVPLAVIVGGDEALFERDRAALRRAGIGFRRVLNATQPLIRSELRRRRQAGDVSPWWLIAAHAGPQGVQLADGIAPPGFWHEVLEGVSLVVLAACEGSTTADELAGLVDTVIWFQDKVLITDAADFTYALFRRLITGMQVDTAYAEAVREVPGVAEFVDLRHS